jgi:hypothetical protein
MKFSRKVHKDSLDETGIAAQEHISAKKPRKTRRLGLILGRVGMIVVVLLLIGSAYGNYYLINKSNKQNTSIVALNKEKTDLDKKVHDITSQMNGRPEYCGAGTYDNYSFGGYYCAPNQSTQYSSNQLCINPYPNQQGLVPLICR